MSVTDPTEAVYDTREHSEQKLNSVNEFGSTGDGCLSLTQLFDMPGRGFQNAHDRAGSGARGMMGSSLCS